MDFSLSSSLSVPAEPAAVARPPVAHMSKFISTCRSPGAQPAQLELAGSPTVSRPACQRGRRLLGRTCSLWRRSRVAGPIDECGQLGARETIGFAAAGERTERMAEPSAVGCGPSASPGPPECGRQPGAAGEPTGAAGLERAGAPRGPASSQRARRPQGRAGRGRQVELRWTTRSSWMLANEAARRLQRQTSAQLA